MVILIGLPRCATTSIELFHRQQGMKVVHTELAELLRGDVDADFVRAESLSDSVRFKTDDRTNWHRYQYIPGAWDKVKDDFVIDPDSNARALKAGYPNAKILLITRDYGEWRDSIFRYAVGQMPWFTRSVADFAITPAGIIHDMIDPARLQGAYSCFDLMVLPYEDLLCEPEMFMRLLCSFTGAKEGKLPKVNQSFNALSRQIFPFPLPEPVKRLARSVMKVH